jgi:hypothetical protein
VITTWQAAVKGPSGRAALWGGGALLGLYVLLYLAHPALPGNSAYPLGWWGWWDQSQYLRSAESLAKGVLTPDAHWYPFGYSILAAPFTLIAQKHAFFYVNFICFALTILVWIRLAGVFEVHPVAALALLAGSLLLDPVIFEQFVIPWNTTPVALCIYLCLYLALRRELLTVGSVIVLSLSAAIVPVVRPTDALLLVPIACAVLYRLVREHDGPSGTTLILSGMSVVLAVFGLYIALHVSTYGGAASPYMVHAGTIGFDARPLAEKLYAILIDPNPLYAEGEGIIRRAPWILLAPYGFAVLFARAGWRAWVIGAVIVINFVFYISFVDLLPHGLWRYKNIHYFKLSYPLLALFAAYAVVAALEDRRHIAGVVAVVLLPLLLRYEVKETGKAWVMIDDERTLTVTCDGCKLARGFVLAPTKLNYLEVSIGAHLALISGRRHRNFYDFRAIPVGETIRTVFPEPISSDSVQLTFAHPHGYSESFRPEAKFFHGYFRFAVPERLAVRVLQLSGYSRSSNGEHVQVVPPGGLGNTIAYFEKRLTRSSVP